MPSTIENCVCLLIYLVAHFLNFIADSQILLFGLFVWEEGVSISGWWKAGQALVGRKNWVCGMDIM